MWKLHYLMFSMLTDVPYKIQNHLAHAKNGFYVVVCFCISFKGFSNKKNFLHYGQGT